MLYYLEPNMFSNQRIFEMQMVKVCERQRCILPIHKSLKLYRQIMAQLTFSNYHCQHNLPWLFTK